MGSKTLTGAALAIAMVALPCAARDSDDDGAYWALFTNGQEVTGLHVKNWHYREKRASLSGRSLFDRSNPVRLLCHTARGPGDLDGPGVVFANGDVLPGRVTGFSPADASRNLPDRLRVVPAAPLEMGRDDRREEDRESRARSLYVRTDTIARVSFAARRLHARVGGAVFLADGTAHAISSVRWTPKGLKALAESQIVSATFDELAEVHLPKFDRAAAVLSDAMVPGGDKSDRIARMATQTGAVLTYCVSTRESRTARSRGRSDMFHAIQPAWALAPIRVPEGSICIRGYRAPTDVPLSLLDARTIEERSFTGFVWPWRRNRNLRGESLRCGSFFAGLGIATHSYSQVSFDLPASAKTFSCHVGLDRAVGAGGCARCAVHRDEPSGQRLWRSDVLVGTGPPARVGPLDVTGARRLVLVTEYAHERRPAGADPGDVRDEVNWLLPMVRIDPKVLRPTSETLHRWVPALHGWSIPAKDVARVKLRWAARHRGPWEVAMDLDRTGLALTRTVQVTPANAILEIAAARGSDKTGHVLDVKARATALKGLLDNHQDVHTNRRGPGDADKQRWSLMEFLGQRIPLTVTMRQDKNNPDGKAMILRSLAFHPIVVGLPPNGKIPTPDVRLGDLEPIKIVWYPQDQRKRETKADPPAPGIQKVHGLSLANAYAVRSGLKMTYRLRGDLRRFIAVVGTDNRYHQGPFVVLVDDKEAWRSSEVINGGQLEHVAVNLPRGAKTITLSVEHNMTTGVWAQAGFLR